MSGPWCTECDSYCCQHVNPQFALMKRTLEAVAAAIDWNEQDASRFYIGEDAAEQVLHTLGGFPWEDGLNNDTVTKFLENRRTTHVPKGDEK